MGNNKSSSVGSVRLFVISSIFRTEYSVVNLSRIAELHQELGNAELTLEAFAAKGLLKKRKGLVKVLGDGELTRALKVSAAKFSAAAKTKIEAAGGSVVVA